jgi:hypothetical protein
MQTYNYALDNLTNLSTAAHLNIQTTSMMAPIVNVTIINNLSIWQLGYLYLFVYYFSIVIHELGHWFAFRIMSKSVKIKFHWEHAMHPYLATGEDADYAPLTDKQKLTVYSYGVLAGFLFIFLSAFVLHWTIFFIALPYSMGIKKDMFLIGQTCRRMKDAVH